VPRNSIDTDAFGFKFGAAVDDGDRGTNDRAECKLLWSLNALDMCICARSSEDAKLTTQELDGAFNFVSLSLSMQAFQAERKVQGRLREDAPAEQEEESA